MTKMLVIPAVFICTTVLALGLASEEVPFLSNGLTVLPVSIVAEKDRFLVLGDKAIVTQAVADNYSEVATDSRGTLHVVQHPREKNYGTSDGKIVVRLHSADNLAGLAADYGLSVDHVFSAAPVGVLEADSIEAAISLVNTLRDDSRVVSADLNVSYYEEQPN